MKIIDAGHQYLLDSLDGNSIDNKKCSNYLKFVKREGENFPFNYSSNSGTNCQEVLRALIDRTKYLQKQKPCAETESIIGCLETALLLFEVRASRMHNINLNVRALADLSSINPCPECGHLQCEHKI